MIYGYARCSTKKQDVQRQLRNITAVYPGQNVKFFFDIFTGTKMEGRKDWNRLMKVIKPDDTICFDSVSRMSRNAEEGIAEYKRLYLMGVHLVFIKEPHINTDVYREALDKCKLPMTGTDVDFILEGVEKFLLALAEKQITLAFAQAEKEVMDLRQRTCEGIVTAKLNGKVPGRPEGKTVQTKKSIECKKMILALSKEFNGSLKDTEIMQFLKITRNTYYKYKRELMQEQLNSLAANDDDLEYTEE